MEPLIINAALTGMVPQRPDSPHVPISPEEIIRDAARCYEAGATVLHLHAREPDGQPSYRRELYQEIIAGVRKNCPGVIISGSCSGRLHREFSQRSQVLDANPDLGSLTLGSLNFPQQASVNDPHMIPSLAAATSERGIRPELEIFDLGMADYASYLVARQLIPNPCYANILLGSLGSASATPDNLCALVRALPRDTIWSATGIGRFQFFINSLAITMGGHVRVGLEDALYYDWDSKRLATNAGLIQRIVKLAEAAGRTIACADEARMRLQLPSKTKSPNHVA